VKNVKYESRGAVQAIFNYYIIQKLQILY